jgi:GNAT superfamily N-acetyltransferase
MKINVCVANESHAVYAQEICDLVYVSAQERGTGIAKRTPEYIAQKMKVGKAVIALTESGELAGFAYVETWSHTLFVANSGLIVAHKYRNTGLAKRIKREVFNLSRRKYPDAKIFSITTGAAVMKINSEMGFRPVPFSELTDDAEFWAGCKGCKNFDILERNQYKMCLCTGLLYDPEEKENKKTIKNKNNEKSRFSIQWWFRHLILRPVSKK